METRPESQLESLAATSPLLLLLEELLIVLLVVEASSSEEVAKLGDLSCSNLSFFSSSGNNRDMDAIVVLVWALMVCFLIRVCFRFK